MLRRASTFSITLITGSIDFYFNEVEFQDGLDFDIGTFTGSVDIHWIQLGLLTDHTFKIDVSTGDISLILNLNSSIGTTFTASIGTGSLSIPSDTFSLPGTGQLDFTLTVGTGDIYATR